TGSFNDPWSHLEPDEYGAELGREARIWKVYVEETDDWDAEQADGWNRSLDVLLVFAALFSAISTTFLIESSGMLKQDPNDVSAAALLAISQMLSTLTNSSAQNPPNIPITQQSDTSDFEPSQKAIIVNTLWYLSLSLSIATSFLAMLAKDWCMSFSANRTGHPWDQAHRRQRKWRMIEHWKMQELIVVLPSLIHVSLLLFAVGLCIYVQDLNKTTAIPMICVVGAALIFYIWCSITASFVDFFPYTTIVSRILRSEPMKVPYSLLRTTIIYGLLALSILVCLFIALFAFLIGLLILLAVIACLPIIILLVLYMASMGQSWGKFTDLLSAIAHKFLFGAIPKVNHFLIESLRVLWHMHVKAEPSEMSQDLTTSQALSWLVQHCETPSSVSIALQAIAGASQDIPKEPLALCQATLHILRRLASSSHENGVASNTLLYIRAIDFLRSHTSKGLNGIEKETEAMVLTLKSTNER
ncbi:unnamed protein product, partial [Rhizoctonia solani]